MLHSRRAVAPKGSARTSVAGGGALGVVGAVVSTLGGFLLVLVATRSLGAEGSGALFAAVALFTVLSNVGKLGTDTSLVRFVPRAIAQGRSEDVPVLVRLSVVASLAAGGIIGATLLVASETVAQLVYADGGRLEVQLVQAVACLIPFATLTLVLLAFIRGTGSVAAFVTVEQMLKPLLRPALVALVWLVGGGVWEALLAWLLPVLLGLVLTLLWARRALRTISPGRVARTVASRGVGREFWGFAVPRAIGGSLEITGPWVGVVMLSGLVGSADAGIFTAVTRVATAGTMALVALRLAAGPHLSAAFAREDMAEVEAVHHHATTWAVLLSFPFFITIAAFPEPVLAIFGASFPGGAAALVILAAANLVNVAVGNVQSIVLMGGRSSWNLFNAAVALAAQVGMGVVLIPRLELAGAALAFASGIVANNLLSAWQAQHGLRLRIWSRGMVLAMVLSATVFTVVAGGARTLAGPSVMALLTATLVAGALQLLLVLRLSHALEVREGWRVLTRRFAAARDR